MFQVLENLRRKSEGDRRSIAVVLAALVTLIIILVWLSVLLSGPPALLDEPAYDERGTSLDFFSSLTDTFLGFFEGLSN